MVFKRRDKRPFWQAVRHFLWPRGGWGRAFHYVKHRVRRLPDSPERIARGIWAGLFTTFTPFYGLHFVVAGLMALIMRGNVLASLMATFFGNPLTYVPIGVVSLQTGHWLLGTRMREHEHTGFGQAFVNAGRDLSHNFFAMFDEQKADWSNLRIFYDDVFFPYMIGGILPGIVTASVGYYIALPLIRAYQKRRKGAIKAKFEALKAKAAAAKKKAEQMGD
ncbi:DUF2062 domain-containing protein [Aliishimia ponticola]|uniref:DUF2062 domain-containing protein n=1 Tax=Aliishimia ponticola TaxID=2499833 RepID=A0A4S4N903_9RHOB|nr:DUF2062 domain-containing protein [Aliishimia ponticola]THH35055.1 DUF2062 domain-containing protein [Aliishimia ponticola]